VIEGGKEWITEKKIAYLIAGAKRGDQKENKK